MTTLINSYRFAGPASFDPLTSISWYAAWWAGNPSWTPPADGAGVSQLDDGIGALHMTQATSGDQPLYRSSVAGLNGKPALEFVSTDYLNQNTITLSQANTVVVVADANGAGAQTLTDAVSNTSARHLVIARSATNVRSMYSGTVLNGSAADTSPHLYVAIFNGASSSLIVDGVTEASGNAGSQSMGLLRLGAAVGTGTNGLVGYLPFAAVYDGVLGTSDRAALLAWSQSHYGTP